jgi:uncharacterized membrane protein YhaH (DUF805 family)
MNWYVEVLKKYAVFAGRARRKEYWMFALWNLIFWCAVVFAQTMMAIGGNGYFAWPFMLYGVATFLPGLAVSVRRLHDTNRSGWWLFISLVPVVGALALLWFMAQDGTPGDNTYGTNPKSPVAAPTYEQPRVPTPVG